jgi:hypothetical protein
MEDGSSQSFLGSLIKNLSSAISDQSDQTESEIDQTNGTYLKESITQVSGLEDELDWEESPIEDQDMVDSINIHKRILDSEIDTIDKELGTILKNKDTVEYLVSLVKKREKLENQVHQLEDDLHGFQKEG